MILDGFGSHYTYEFYTFAKQLKIDLFVLPPHLFYTYYTATGCGMLSAFQDRLGFLAAFTWMRTQTFTSSTIRSAFQKTGFVPYDPEVVLEKIRNLAPRATTPEESQATSLVLVNTPHKAKDVIEFGRWFQDLLATQAFIIPEGMRRLLAQFVKRSIANGFLRQIAKQDLEIIHKEAVVKRARKTLAGTVAQKGGWMSVDQICKSLSVVEETAKEKAEKALKLATRAKEIQQEKADKAVKSFLQLLDHGVWKMVHAHWGVFLNT